MNYIQNCVSNCSCPVHLTFFKTSVDVTVAKQSLLAHACCTGCLGFLVVDNWAAGSDQTDVVNVQESN